MRLAMDLKSRIKTNPTIYPLYRLLTFLINIPIADYLRFRRLSLIKKVYPYTMGSYQGLVNVLDLAERLEDEKVDGAFVECGVWKGGCAAIMGHVIDRWKSNRKVWLFDSFEGLPEPTDEDGNEAIVYASGRSSGNLATIEKCVGPLEDVNRVFFSVLNIPRDRVEFRQGWFQDTLPTAKSEIGPIALLRLDGDWYESIKVCLDNLYDNVVPGGYVIIDDYLFWEGSRVAVDEFLADRGLAPELVKVDKLAVYFQKK